MSDTPRTDDRIVYGALSGDDSIGAPWVNAPFARQLERELNVANARIDLLEACNADVARIAEERNEALDRIKRLEEAGDRVIYWVDASNARLEYFDALNNWKQAKEDKP